MQSRVHSVWQIQHQSKLQPALVQTMCMQPPARSVGVRHFGHGLVVTLIATFDASSHLASATLLGSTEYSHEPMLLIAGDSGRQSPMWKPWRQFLQKTNCKLSKLIDFHEKQQSSQLTPQPFWQCTRVQSSSTRIPMPQFGWGQKTPPAWRTNSSVANLWYRSYCSFDSNLKWCTSVMKELSQPTGQGSV